MEKHRDEKRFTLRMSLALHRWLKWRERLTIGVAVGFEVGKENATGRFSWRRLNQSRLLLKPGH